MMMKRLARDNKMGEEMLKKREKSAAELILFLIPPQLNCKWLEERLGKCRKKEGFVRS